MQSFKASVLVTVVVISLLMLLFVCGIFLSKEYYGQPLRQWLTEQQERMWLDSGFRLYGRETVGCLTDTAGYLLFPPDERSRIRVKVLPWGLYEVVTVSLGKKSYSVRWLGGKQAGYREESLYVCDGGSLFGLAGSTNVRGKAALPLGRVNYVPVNAEFFSGAALPDSAICRSDGNLPPVWEAARKRATDYCRQNDLSFRSLEEITGAVRSFREETVGVACTGRVEGDYRGRFLLYSSSILYIGPACRLEHVLVAAPSVIIGKGFRGSLQVFARDTVVVDEGAELRYPSGIFVCGGNPGRRVEIRDSSVVNGYVIVDGGEREELRPLLNYRQSRTASVRGLVYVDGIAQLEGRVCGSLLLKESYYFSPAGYYKDILYRTEVSGNREMVWPLWMKGEGGKEVIEWLE